MNLFEVETTLHNAGWKDAKVEHGLMIGVRLWISPKGKFYALSAIQDGVGLVDFSLADGSDMPWTPESLSEVERGIREVNDDEGAHKPGVLHFVAKNAAKGRLHASAGH